MKKYLVTGGAGFIGSNFVKYLLEKYDSEVQITILDALTYAGNLATISEEIKRDNVRFVKGDIADEALVNSLMQEEDPDYVVNFAAESHVDRSISNPRIFLETNVIGTQTLLDAAMKVWKLGAREYQDGKRYLQISTDEVYGSLPRREGAPMELKLSEELAKVVSGREHLQAFGDGFFTETSPLKPNSPYSASKTAADLLVMAYYETYGLPVNITRCSNNYGPYHFPEKLIPLIIKNILEGKRLPVYGRGENVRDWLYVEDHCKAIDMVLRQGRVGEIYNVGGFNEEQNIEIVRRILRIVAELVAENPQYRRLLKIAPEQVNESLIEYVTDRPGHDMRYAINPEKIATQLGWYPETPFNQGIVRTVQWYLDNPQWVEEVASGAYRDYYSKMYDNR